MMTSVRLAVLLLSALSVSAASSYGNIQTCDTKYIKPGEDFQIACRSDHASSTKIYVPSEEFPTTEQLLAESNNLLPGRAERSTTINEYEDATIGVDDGIYTCVVQHGPDIDPPYSVAECRVVIVDLCEEAGCPDKKICEADYETGVAECTCNYQCPQQFDILCSDTCEVFWHECALEEQVCVDGVERQVASKGFCPNRAAPVIREINVDIVAEYGEALHLTSGLVEDGTPWATIHWVFYPVDGSAPHYLSVREDHSFIVTPDTVGIYKITLMHCMDADNAIRNEYRVAVIEEPVTSPQPFITTPTVPPGRMIIPRHVCSVFPGGIVEDFNSNAHHYDLACTHILAADLMPSGTFFSPWFIYATFDKFEGATSVMSMTFYHGSTVFEVQRGWMVVLPDGSKAALQEGVPLQIGSTGCSVTYEEMHIHASCPEFSAYYDGIMSCHVQLKAQAGPQDLVKDVTNIGLCFDDQSGFRPNWQVGGARDVCTVDVNKETCPDSDESCSGYSEGEKLLDHPWTRCGDGAGASCAELNCDGSLPTPMQQCALELANAANCELKQSGDVSGSGDNCPADPCEWQNLVVANGCPQDSLPFDCA